MTAIYVRWIRAGRITIESVPARWRQDVLQALEVTADDDA